MEMGAVKKHEDAEIELRTLGKALKLLPDEQILSEKRKIVRN